MAERKHVRRRDSRPWYLAGIGVTIVAILVLGAVLIVRRSSTASSPSSAAAEIVDPTELHVLPATGTADVPLDTPVVVLITAGRLDAVTATAADGTALAGTTSADGTRWQSTGPLAPATSYTVNASGTSPAGHALHTSSTFVTVTPTDTLTPTITPNDGLTVGVGQPVVVRFDKPVADKAAMLGRMKVDMSNPVVGAWHWFTDKEVHFRPKDYWPSGEQVTVTVDVTGFDNGGGVYGDGSHTSHFTIGDARISTVDLDAHTMTVTQNGQTVKTMDVSAGRDKYPTMTGTHIALYRQQDVLMDSSTVGIPRNSPDGYYEHVYFDVAITDGGEFVHAAPWSTGAQGNSNVSHGCVNLSNADAEWFFNFSRMGDVIDVVNGPRAPELGDHGVMDWSTPWSDWTAPPATHTVS